MAFLSDSVPACSLASSALTTTFACRTGSPAAHGPPQSRFTTLTSPAAVSVGGPPSAAGVLVTVACPVSVPAAVVPGLTRRTAGPTAARSNPAAVSLTDTAGPAATSSVSPAAAAAAVTGSARDRGTGAPVAHLVVLAVHPGARRLGMGRRLLAATETWARDEGATELVIGGPVGVALWPGVDVRTMPAMLCLAEASGYEVAAAPMNLSFPATFRAAAPDGVAVRRVLEAEDEVTVGHLIAAEFPEWSEVVARSIEHGACLVAFDGGAAVGVVVHSVDRAGWLGPVGTAVGARGRGIGAALVGAVAQDLMVAGLRDVQVVGAERVGLFVRAGGAVSRVFRTYRRSLT